MGNGKGLGAAALALRAALFALFVIAVGGVHAQQDKPQMGLQITEDSDQFKIKNIGSDPIDDLEITTYPPPETRPDGTIIVLVAYAFRKTVGTLGKNEIVVVRRDELRNNHGAVLSKSKYEVGAIIATGKIAGHGARELFTGEDGTWVPVPAQTRRDANTMLLLGPMDEPF